MPMYDEEMLDRLDELKLKGFQDIDNENSPSSAATSLPTPRLDGDQAIEARIQVSESQMPSHILEPSPIRQFFPPPAPKIKDLDSFTDGTGKGSFDSLPQFDIEEPITVNAISLEMLPRPNTFDFIESWRADVHLATPPLDISEPDTPTANTKRPHEDPESDDDDDEKKRRIKPRPQSFSCHTVPSTPCNRANVPPRPPSCPYSHHTPD